MVVLNLLATGGVGGIEVLAKSVNENALWDNYVAFMFDGGELEMEIPEDRKIVLSRGNKNRLSPKYVKTLYRFCNRHKVEIVVIHHHNWYLQKIYLKLKKRLPNIKYIFMFHHCFDKESDLGHIPILKSIKLYYYKKAMAASDKILSVSERGKQSFLEAFPEVISRGKVDVVYNGIDTETIGRGAENALLVGNVFEILYIGRLVKVKGVDLLIGALPYLDSKVPIHLTIVGDGAERIALESQAEKIRSKEISITFTGMQREKEKYLAVAHVFVYPSVWEEIFGISIVEAMAYGISCVAFNVGGIPEIIKDGSNGFLAVEKNVKQLAEAIQRVIDIYEHGHEDRLCKKAKETADRFSIEQTCKKLYEEYGKLL